MLVHTYVIRDAIYISNTLQMCELHPTDIIAHLDAAPFADSFGNHVLIDFLNDLAAQFDTFVANVHAGSCHKFFNLQLRFAAE